MVSSPRFRLSMIVSAGRSSPADHGRAVACPPRFHFLGVEREDRVFITPELDQPCVRNFSFARTCPTYCGLTSQGIRRGCWQTPSTNMGVIRINPAPGRYPTYSIPTLLRPSIRHSAERARGASHARSFQQVRIDRTSDMITGRFPYLSTSAALHSGPRASGILDPGLPRGRIPTLRLAPGNPSCFQPDDPDRHPPRFPTLLLHECRVITH